MRNHDQKIRDMARSILPSAGRQAARRHKQISAQRARARNRARLARMWTHLSDLDGFEEPLDRYDLDDERWGTMLYYRRGADKVAPLVRWAEARIARRPELAHGDYWTRRNHFRIVLGDTLVGRHALSHLEHLFGVENPYLFGEFDDGTTWEERRARKQAAARAELQARAAVLDEVLAVADVRRLDARIAALTPPAEEHWSYHPTRGRFLTGTAGFEPWLLVDPDRGRDRWLAPAGPGPDGDRQRIAFEALAQVHAEIYGLP